MYMYMYIITPYIYEWYECWYGHGYTGYNVVPVIAYLKIGITSFPISKHCRSFATPTSLIGFLDAFWTRLYFLFLFLFLGLSCSSLPPSLPPFSNPAAHVGSFRCLPAGAPPHGGCRAKVVFGDTHSMEYTKKHNPDTTAWWSPKTRCPAAIARGGPHGDPHASIKLATLSSRLSSLESQVVLRSRLAQAETIHHRAEKGRPKALAIAEEIHTFPRERLAVHRNDVSETLRHRRCPPTKPAQRQRTGIDQSAC